jgi:2-keto-4-pentenoate hydratase/2-oxohepta-3-ene-1,7-dioic acid hydratase in catechol pathway
VLATGGNLDDLAMALRAGSSFDPEEITYFPPFGAPGKILCVGINYSDHAAEANFELPDYPALFPRFATTLVGHNQPLVRPQASPQFDYEGEMAAIIGKRGRHIPKSKVFEHIAGYSVFNDASVRDYQFKSPQWTPGKNFDGSGGFGPALVTADVVPPGGAGLKIETRLNGDTLQSANTNQLIFNVADLISIISEVMTFEPGDVLVTGTPSGVGFARKPPLFMKAGDICEVEIEGIGLLSNPVIDEA